MREVRDREPKERSFFVRYLTCLARGHLWDPYPPHLREAGMMECVRCGLRRKPFHGLQT